jgi:peptidoglycan/LPS O-acetylase OafA/YrhL
VVRGLAILSVLFCHGLYWHLLQQPPAHSLAAKISGLMVFGWLGVFLFFVLSGFLITGILLDSKPKPQYWRNFYIRRALRILPAFAVALVVFAVWKHPSWVYILLCLGYMANLASLIHIPGPTYTVLWSLAVEEQFYLGWPWLVKVLTRRHFAFAVVATIVLSPVLRYLSASGRVPLGDVHSMTWLISDNLAMGALLALLLRSRWGRVQVVRRIAFAMLAAGMLLLFGGLPLGILHRNNLIGSTFQTVPFEFLFASLVLLALMVGDKPRIYSWTRVFRFFGYISYGLYLYHELVYSSVDLLLKRIGIGTSWSAWQWIGRFVGESALAVVIAFLSRRYFEEFFLTIKGRLTPAQQPGTSAEYQQPA